MGRAVANISRPVSRQSGSSEEMNQQTVIFLVIASVSMWIEGYPSLI